MAPTALLWSTQKDIPLEYAEPRGEKSVKLGRIRSLRLAGFTRLLAQDTMGDIHTCVYIRSNFGSSGTANHLGVDIYQGSGTSSSQVAVPSNSQQVGLHFLCCARRGVLPPLSQGECQVSQCTPLFPFPSQHA